LGGVISNGREKNSKGGEYAAGISAVHDHTEPVAEFLSAECVDAIGDLGDAVKIAHGRENTEEEAELESSLLRERPCAFLAGLEDADLDFLAGEFFQQSLFEEAEGDTFEAGYVLGRGEAGRGGGR
jgi:hypothetical protein